MRQIYLDFNATTPIDPRVAESMRAAMNDGYGNPSSPHWAGAPAKRMVEAGRKRVASLLSSSWIERPADRLSEARIAADHRLGEFPGSARNFASQPARPVCEMRTLTANS
jgi:Aminotransferase class-V